METELSDRPIVVGFDGSIHARLALRWAVEEAARLNSAVEVVFVLNWLPEFTAADADNVAVRQRALDMTVEATDEAKKLQPAVAVTVAVETGHPAGVLCDLSTGARMVVLGSRGHGGFAGMLAGSVTMAVATHAHCPVVVVRPVTESRQGLPVIVGVDDSKPSRLAVDYAYEQAASRGVPLVTVQAWHPFVPDPYAGLYLHQEQIAEIESAQRRLLHDFIRPAADRYPGVPVRSRLSTAGPATALTEASHDAQLVVVGSRGHGEVTGLLLGSVGLHLLHHAACTVMIVREPRGPRIED